MTVVIAMRASGIGAVRPVGYDPATGQVAWRGVIPPQRMPKTVADLARRDWLVERDHGDGQLGSPYTMVVSAPGDARTGPACYLAGPVPLDPQAALLVQAAWPPDEDPPDAWEVAATWRWHGFVLEEIAGWLAGGILEPWHARALADLGVPPDRAPDVAWIARGEVDGLAELLAADRVRHPERQAPARLHTAILEALRRLPRRLPPPTWADVSLEDAAAAELLARRLMHARPTVARAAAEEITTLLWRPLGVGTPGGFQVAPGWWRTPLGRACARALGTTAWPPPTDPDLTVRDVMAILDVDRGRVDQLLAAGELWRTAYGRLRLAHPPA